ncbi:MAG: hypothetical protein PGN12_10810 [Sphingomonas phyllosphaerae]
MRVFGRPKKQSSDVFGISAEILVDSYVDRGSLDAEIQKQLRRRNHIALRGESKCGKSWIRKRNVPDAIVVQCRLKKTSADIYKDILAELGISIITEKSDKLTGATSVEVSGEMGRSIIAKIGAKLGASLAAEAANKYKVLGKGENDLKFICEAIKASGRRVVIEDFHYMSVDERKAFSFDMKAMWDYETYLIVVGVWSQSNMLIYLNPDLSGRIEEISIYWSDEDLKAVIQKGSCALNVSFSVALASRLVEDSFGNAGLLQKLALNTLDEVDVTEEQENPLIIDNINAGEAAGMKYAEQLNPAYQQFAKRVSSGIRSRTDATGIYAHAMAVIMGESDDDLKKGLDLHTIFAKANAKQPRIKKGNLRTVLEKFEGLQIDEDGRGLVLSFNEATDEIHVVDRQVLLYRKYATVKWPWDNMIAEADGSEGYAD